MLKKLLKYKLKKCAQKIIEKHNPEIICITGSVGKTTTKELVYYVLKSKLNVRRSLKNFNNEIGVPLTIIGADSPGKSISGWLKIFKKASLILKDDNYDYPDILILEMGVDRPGDMDYLMSFVKPDIGIVTTIGQSHMEYFGSEANIQKEKGRLIENVKKDGWSILNFDNEKTRKIANRSKAKVMTFGMQDGADIGARDCTYKDGITGDDFGVNFKLRHTGGHMPMFIPGVLSKDMVYAALAASAVGITYGMNLIEISDSLKEAKIPAGRMNVIKGLNNSVIIDDTYNASPQSTISLLESIRNVSVFNEKRKIAVLGDMLELGDFSKKGHKQVGACLVDNKFDILLAVGEESKNIMTEALKKGLKEDNVYYFNNSTEAGEFAKELVESNDIVIVKGSRGMRMENVVNMLIKN